MAKREVILPGRGNRGLHAALYQGARAVVVVNGIRTEVPLGRVVALEEDVIRVLKDSRWSVQETGEPA